MWPEKNAIEVVIGKLSRHGFVEFPDPYNPNMIYRIDHESGGCPNVGVWSTAPNGSHRPCVTCEGFMCEGCDEGVAGADRWGLAKALVGAIFAGRAVNELSDSYVVSSRPLSYGIRKEVTSYGEGSAGEETRDGRSEEQEAPSREAGSNVPVFYDPTARFPLPHFSIDASRPFGSITINHDRYSVGQVQLHDVSGQLVAEMSFNEAWATLFNYGRNRTLVDSRRLLRESGIWSIPVRTETI